MDEKTVDAFLKVELELWRHIEKFKKNMDKFRKCNTDAEDDEYDICAHMSDVYAAQVGRGLMNKIDAAHYYKKTYLKEDK